MRAKLYLCAASIVLAGCGGGRVERAETAAFQPAQLADIGAAAFEQLKAKRPMSADYAQQRLARCVAERLVETLPAEDDADAWEVLVFDDDGDLAFALPGARIGVKSGLLLATKREDQLAAAIAHSLAHLLLGHVEKRVASAMNADTAEMAAQIFRGDQGPSQSKTLFSLLGLGDQVAQPAPYSGSQESQAEARAAELLIASGYGNAEQAPVRWRGAAAEPSQWRALHPVPDDWQRDVDVEIGVSFASPCASSD